MPHTPSLLDPQSFCFWKEGTTASHSKLLKNHSDKKNLIDSVVGGFSNVCLIQKSTCRFLSDFSKKRILRWDCLDHRLPQFVLFWRKFQECMIFWCSSFFLSVVSGCENFWSTTWSNPTALWQKIQNKHPLSLAGLHTSAATGKARTSLLEAITEHPRVQVIPLVPVWEGPLPHPRGVLNSPRRTCSFGPPLTRQGLLRWERLLEVTYYMPGHCSSFERQQ